MKWFVIVLIFSNLAFARTSELIKCLGAEEKIFHLKKETGPSYELNQRLIAELVQISNTTMTPEALKAICSSSKGVSWKLLELSLTKGKNIFHIPKDVTGGQRQVTEGMVEGYILASKEIFLAVLTQIQALAPSPDCLTQEYPELIPFFLDLKYLQEEVDTEKLFKGRAEKIFNKLQTYPEAIKRCQTRLKKKLKPESTAPPK
jgi:hypothetical protein